MGRNTIIKTLMRREGIDEAEAREWYSETMEEVRSAISCGDYELAEEIFMEDFGLEVDYLIDALI